MADPDDDEKFTTHGSVEELASSTRREPATALQHSQLRRLLPVTIAEPVAASAATWANMPNKSPLAIIALSRVVDFFQQASLQTIMCYQLQSFDRSLSASTISQQAGIFQGAFTAAQIFTAIFWGYIADSHGRKPVLLIGLLGTGLSLIGSAFSTSFKQAVAWRVLAGAINGTVGAARTMLAENVGKQYYSRAFLLLPLAFNIAFIAGPIMSVALIDPINNIPALSGIAWMAEYPYALTILFSAFLQFVEAILVFFCLRETLRAFNTRKAPVTVAERLRQLYRRSKVHSSPANETQTQSLLSQSGKTLLSGPKLSLFKILTTNVLVILLSTALFDFHMGAFSALWPLFLSTARGHLSSTTTHITHGVPMHAVASARLAGGLSWPPHTVGIAMALVGVVGVFAQLLLYPKINERLGLLRCFRYSLILFPIGYFLAPFLATLPSTTPAPLPATGPLIWLGLTLVLLLQVTARTFALPACLLLINNACPHPSVLGTINGFGQAVSATFRTLGPSVAGGWFAQSLRMGNVALAWWGVAAVAMLGCAVSILIKEGNGNERKSRIRCDEEEEL